MTSTRQTGADGAPSYVLDCSGAMRERADCLAKAGAICTQGYAALDDQTQPEKADVVRVPVTEANRDHLTISCRSGRGEWRKNWSVISRSWESLGFAGSSLASLALFVSTATRASRTSDAALRVAIKKRRAQVIIP